MLTAAAAVVADVEVQEAIVASAAVEITVSFQFVTVMPMLNVGLTLHRRVAIGMHTLRFHHQAHFQSLQGAIMRSGMLQHSRVLSLDLHLLSHQALH